MMKDIKQILQTECYGQDLEQRRIWYSPAAESYQNYRPRYPQEVVDQVVAIAHLSADSTILEVGCGPAIATPAFAALGCRITGVEPNPDFYQLAQQTCAAYPNVTLQNCSFEEWEPQPQQFDAVLAASSFHWIPPKIGYPKAAAALRPAGHLILLWNNELRTTDDVHQQLLTVYQAHAPELVRAYEDEATQVEILDEMGQMAIESGYFTEMKSGYLQVETTYTVDEYLTLLNTYSPHLKLESQKKQALFSGLRDVLMQDGDRVRLTFISMFHVARLKREGLPPKSPTRGGL